MANYTTCGSAALDQRIDEDLQRIAEAVKALAQAGILLGGYGRGEGTPFINPDGSQTPFNDYDLVVVVKKINSAIRQTFQTLEKQLTEQIGLPVDLCPYSISHLRKCEKSLLNYEMKHGHKVLWGDPEVLDAMPDFSVPRSEGARLLLNRGKLLLDIKRRLTTSEPLTNAERIRFIKFINKVWLAFGDAALLAAGQYDLSYTIKKERIPSIGNCPDRADIIEGYLQAIQLKDWGDFQPLETYNVRTEFKKITAIYLRFIPWYRTQYSNRECAPPKAIALNLKWNKTLSLHHPRIRLYDAICELLQDRSQISHEHFYALQRRFS